MLKSSALPAWLVPTTVAVGIVLRFLPHPWNLTPVGAMFLFCGFASRRAADIMLPLGAYALSDVIFNLIVYRSPLDISNVFVWTAFALVWLIGITLKRAPSPLWIYPVGAVGAIFFFAISNFGVWVSSSMQPHTIAGLAATYVAGLPFFQPTLIGDLAYATIFFGAALALSVASARRSAAST